jgi:hypothetical protein
MEASKSYGGPQVLWRPNLRGRKVLISSKDGRNSQKNVLSRSPWPQNKRPQTFQNYLAFFLQNRMKTNIIYYCCNYIKKILLRACLPHRGRT